MGISMLGGILSGLVDLLNDFVMGLLEILFQYIIGPILMIIGDIVKLVLCQYLYIIGTFILSFIDFIEMLFRALAGLPTEDVTMTFTEGAGNLEGSSDLLLQLIRSEGVQQAFLSMCIVGLFLLIICTIFQMIKVEYTTEGAKNAKGPILEKTFKGLANLVLLPLLVIFGVFIGNQILDLLDTATKGDSQYKISGLVFATSASDAFLRDGEGGGDNNDEPPEMSYSPQLTIISNIKWIFNKIKVRFAEAWDGNVSNEQKDFIKSESERTQILDDYMSGERDYASHEGISTDFDFTKINYVVMIVGGIFVLKALYLACFGMISRLYTCTILFIISPAVIGMSPVNEGNLGKWRGRFIGSCLSAYGVVVSLNLFFVIVRVLMSIDVQFNAPLATFSSQFMTGLFKLLLVIAGVTMIEKFSKELGSYFGAEDSISAGKELEGAMAAPVKAAIGAVAGAGAMAVGAGALAGKLTGKLTGGSAAFKEGKGEKTGFAGVAAGVGNMAKTTGNNMIKPFKDAKQKFDDGKKFGFTSAGKKKKLDELQNFDVTQDSEVKRYSSLATYNKQLADQTSDPKEKEKYLRRARMAANQKLNVQEQKSSENASLLEKQRTIVASDDKKAAARKQKVDNFGLQAKSATIAGYGAMLNLGKGLISDAVPGDLGKKLFGDVSKAYKESAKRGPEFETAQKHLEEIKSDKIKQSSNSAVQGVIDSKNRQQVDKIMNLTVENMNAKKMSAKFSAQKTASQYNEVLNKQGMYQGISDEQQQRMLANLLEKLDDMNAVVNKDASGKIEVLDIKGFDTDSIKDAMQKAMAEGIRMDKFSQYIADAIANDGNRTATELNNIREAIEKAVSKMG